MRALAFAYIVLTMIAMGAPFFGFRSDAPRWWHAVFFLSVVTGVLLATWVWLEPRL